MSVFIKTHPSTGLWRKQQRVTKRLNHDPGPIRGKNEWTNVLTGSCPHGAFAKGKVTSSKREPSTCTANDRGKHITGRYAPLLTRQQASKPRPHHPLRVSWKLSALPAEGVLETVSSAGPTQTRSCNWLRELTRTHGW